MSVRTLARRADALHDAEYGRWKAAWNQHTDAVNHASARVFTVASFDLMNRLCNHALTVSEQAWEAACDRIEAHEQARAERPEVDDRAWGEWLWAYDEAQPPFDAYDGEADPARADFSLWPDALPEPPGDPLPLLRHAMACAVELDAAGDPDAAAVGAQIAWGMTKALAIRGDGESPEMDELRKQITAKIQAIIDARP